MTYLSVPYRRCLFIEDVTYKIRWCRGTPWTARDSVTPMPRERRCQICGSIKLYKSVGGMVCDQGHVAAVRLSFVDAL